MRQGPVVTRERRLAALPHLSDMEEIAAGNYGLAFSFPYENAM